MDCRRQPRRGGAKRHQINDSQREAWRKTIEIFEDGRTHPRTVALFPHERIAPTPEENIVRIRLDSLELHRPRQWGACWMACQLYEQLDLDGFWAERLPPGRKGTRWDLVLQALCAYRLIDPGMVFPYFAEMVWAIAADRSPGHRSVDCGCRGS